MARLQILWNKKILDAIRQNANKKLPNAYGNIDEKVSIDIPLDTPNGKILLTQSGKRLVTLNFGYCNTF